MLMEKVTDTLDSSHQHSVDRGRRCLVITVISTPLSIRLHVCCSFEPSQAYNLDDTNQAVQPQKMIRFRKMRQCTIPGSKTANALIGCEVTAKLKCALFWYVHIVGFLMWRLN